MKTLSVHGDSHVYKNIRHYYSLSKWRPFQILRAMIYTVQILKNVSSSEVYSEKGKDVILKYLCLKFYDASHLYAQSLVFYEVL